jgi:hypothetical protein
MEPLRMNKGLKVMTSVLMGKSVSFLIGIRELWFKKHNLSIRCRSGAFFSKIPALSDTTM